MTVETISSKMNGENSGSIHFINVISLKSLIPLPGALSEH